MRPPLVRRLSTSALSVLVLGLMACGESGTPFDPTTLTESTDAVITAMQNSSAVQSLGTFGDKMTVGAPSLVSATFPDVPLEAGSFPAWAERRLRAIQAANGASLSVAAPNGVFPPNAPLGKTFTYNIGTGTYQLSNETGAPSNGVRFILYAVDPVSHAIVTPLNAIGYVDLTDESSGNSTTLHIKAVVSSKTLVDYTASASVQLVNGVPSGATVSAKGFVSDGTTQVTFDLSQSYLSTSGISVVYKLTVPEKDIDLLFEASLNLSLVFTGRLTIKHAGNTTIVNVTGTQLSITGDIKHNGTVVVKITGTADHPVFADGSGNSMSDHQVQTLNKLFDFTDDVVDAIDFLLKPAHKLLTPGIAWNT